MRFTSNDAEKALTKNKKYVSAHLKHVGANFSATFQARHVACQAYIGELVKILKPNLTLRKRRSLHRKAKNRTI